MGGTLTIDFALAYPHMVSALVLVATGPNGYDRWGDEIRQGWAGGEGGAESGRYGARHRDQPAHVGGWTIPRTRRRWIPRCAPASTRCSPITCREKAKARPGTSSRSRPAD